MSGSPQSKLAKSAEFVVYATQGAQISKTWRWTFTHPRLWPYRLYLYFLAYTKYNRGIDCVLRVSDLDECSENLDQCDPNSVCGNTVGSYCCACHVGYHGSGFNCTGNVQSDIVIMRWWIAYQLADWIGVAICQLCSDAKYRYFSNKVPKYILKYFISTVENWLYVLGYWLKVLILK